jgi:hypothetical protein
MFHGAREGLVTWFDDLGYRYHPALHGVASDWALDLVAIGFQKPFKVFGHSITTIEQLQSASCQFVASYRSHSGAVLYRGGSESMMIGTKSLKHRVRARMQKYAGVQPAPGDGGGDGAKASAGGGDPGLQVWVGGGSLSSSEGGAAAQGLRLSAPGITSKGGGDADDVAAGGAQQLLQPASSKWATGWWRQFASCYGRELLAVTRNPADVAGRLLTFTWVGLLTGVLFYALAGDASSIMSRLSLLFSNLCFLTLMPYISMSLYTADKKFYLAGE